MQAKRIAIIGISGAGKSTLSRKLAAKTSLPLYHMDQLYWRGKWEAVPEEEYVKAHELLVQQEAWIIEGYIDAKMASRLRRADLVIWLDYSGLRCAWHLILRRIQFHKQSRPELPKEALERLKWSFFKMVLLGGERQDIENALTIARSVNLKRFTSPHQLNAFLKSYVNQNRTYEPN